MPARIEDGEVIDGGITCPNCGEEMTAAPKPRGELSTDLYCANCGYSELR